MKKMLVLMCLTAAAILSGCKSVDNAKMIPLNSSAPNVSTMSYARAVELLHFYIDNTMYGEKPAMPDIDKLGNTATSIVVYRSHESGYIGIAVMVEDKPMFQVFVAHINDIELFQRALARIKKEHNK